MELIKKTVNYFFTKNFYLKNSLIIERMEIDFIFSRFIKKKKLRILDIGAHHGEFLDIFSNLQFGKIRQSFEIFCFEPFIANFNIIKKKINCLDGNIKAHIYNFAISNKTEKKFFYVGSSDTLVTCENYWLKKFANEFLNYKKMLMQCFSFKDFIKKYKFDTNKDIDLLKIDVEGHDFIVLNNVLQNNFAVNSVMIEFDIKNISTVKSIINYLKIKKFIKIFIFGRSGICTSYIGEYADIRDFLKIIKNNNIEGGNLVAFKKTN